MLRGSRSRLLLFVRCLLVALAAGAALAGFAILRDGDAQADKGRVTYGCPMHPQVRSARAGDCPICRMALEPVKGARPEHEHAHAARPPHAAEAPHEPVPPGSFSLPSSPIFRAFDAVSRAKVHPISLEMRGPAAVDAANGGVALFFVDEGELLQVGEEGSFSPTAESPEMAMTPVPVRVSRAAPVRWDDRTSLVRFETQGAELLPGTTGSVKFATRLRRGLVVKASAIVPSPEGTWMFVVSSDRRTFTRRKVEIGNVIYGLAAVVSGLAPGENVAAKHTFSLDAEWRARQEVSL